MHSTPQHLRASLKFATALLFVGCAQSATEATSGQRAVNVVTLDVLDVRATITSGTFRSLTAEDLSARAAAPIAKLAVSGGPNATGELSVTVTNLHANSELTLLAVEPLNDVAYPGCPNVLQEPSIPCSTSLAAVGDPCTQDKDCPSGLTCAAGMCSPTSDLDVCVTPEFVRDDVDATAVTFASPTVPCLSYVYGFAPPASDTTRFGVVGPTSSLGRLTTAVNRLKQENVDFVVILGENVESSSSSGIDALDRRLSTLGVSVVYVVGEDAEAVDSGQYALQRLGPNDHFFVLNGTRFVTFYSPDRKLAANGLIGLERYLLAAQKQVEAAGTGTIIAFTNTPPIDPNGIRDLGFKNHIEGGRTLSLLNEFGVTDLFAGRIPAPDAATFGGVTTWLTGSSDPLIGGINEALLVESKDVPGGEVTVKRISL